MDSVFVNKDVLAEKAVEEKYESGAFEAGGYKWHIELHPMGTGVGAGDHLSLFLALGDSTVESVKVYAEFTLRILDQVGAKHRSFQAKYWFRRPSDGWGWPSTFLQIGNGCGDGDHLSLYLALGDSTVEAGRDGAVQSIKQERRWLHGDGHQWLCSNGAATATTERERHTKGQPRRKCCWREKRRERAAAMTTSRKMRGREKTATEENDEEIRREKVLLEKLKPRPKPTTLKTLDIATSKSPTVNGASPFRPSRPTPKVQDCAVNIALLSSLKTKHYRKPLTLSRRRSHFSPDSTTRRRLRCHLISQVKVFRLWYGDCFQLGFGDHDLCPEPGPLPSLAISELLTIMALFWTSVPLKS
ncbi:hypothetical protein CUMW_013750 [Citrus unshiu]|nr:hypothetical protein CUMW_013750 [Citrus unshiu]